MGCRGRSFFHVIMKNSRNATEYVDSYASERQQVLIFYQDPNEKSCLRHLLHAVIGNRGRRSAILFGQDIDVRRTRTRIRVLLCGVKTDDHCRSVVV